MTVLYLLLGIMCSHVYAEVTMLVLMKVHTHSRLLAPICDSLPSKDKLTCHLWLDFCPVEIMLIGLFPAYTLFSTVDSNLQLFQILIAYLC